MKKLFSIFLLLSIATCVCNTNVLAGTDNITDNALGQEGQGQKVEQQKSSAKKPVSKKNSAPKKSMRSTEAATSQVSLNPVSSKFAKIVTFGAITGVVLGFAACTSYLTYKVCDKIGLVNELKSVFECIGKTKALKNLLICGAVCNGIGAAIAGYLVYEYGYDFVEAQFMASIFLAQICPENRYTKKICEIILKK